MPTYEEELDALWATYGPEVRTEDVAELVRSGVTVYAFGYGDDDAVEEGFDALDESDLWAFEPNVPGDKVDTFDDDLRDDIVASWAPFRLDPDESDKVKTAYAAYVKATSTKAPVACCAGHCID